MTDSCRHRISTVFRMISVRSLLAVAPRGISAAAGGQRTLGSASSAKDVKAIFEVPARATDVDASSTAEVHSQYCDSSDYAAFGGLHSAQVYLTCRGRYLTELVALWRRQRRQGT